MTERIKLENPGDELTLSVATVSPEEIGGYDYWKVSDGQTEIVVPQKSIAAQLDRVGVMEATEMAGKTVRFSRSEKVNKFGKPYWNLDLVTTNGKPPVSKSAPAKQPISYSSVADKDLPPELRNVPEEETRELAAKVGVNLSSIQKDLAIYQGITEWVIREIAPLYEKSPLGWSPESATAAVATLYIQAKK